MIERKLKKKNILFLELFERSYSCCRSVRVERTALYSDLMFRDDLYTCTSHTADGPQNHARQSTLHVADMSHNNTHTFSYCATAL